MRTVKVKILKEEALVLLRQLEKLAVIEVTDEAAAPKAAFDVRSLVGSISKQEGEQILRHIQSSKEEWDDRI